MAKLILTRGIQASGKSTWAKRWVRDDPERRVRVNRDDLRAMLFAADGTLLSWRQEQQVTEVERAIAKTALDKGKDVVVDAMNLRAKWVKQWATLGYPIEFRDFPIQLEDALAMNADRDRPIPEEAIIKAFRHTPGGQIPPAPNLSENAPRPYMPDWQLPGAFLFDIDGTLAHMTGRSPYDYSRVSEDTVDTAVAYLLDVLSAEHHIVVMSGRDEACREVTEAWLNAHDIQFDHLFMRAAGDTRKDATVKRELFDAHVRNAFNVRGVIDDRNQVVAMWRDLGLKCYQAQEGAF
jgi:predicted kinase